LKNNKSNLFFASYFNLKIMFTLKVYLQNHNIEKDKIN